MDTYSFQSYKTQPFMHNGNRYFAKVSRDDNIIESVVQYGGEFDPIRSKIVNEVFIGLNVSELEECLDPNRVLFKYPHKHADPPRSIVRLLKFGRGESCR